MDKEIKRVLDKDSQKTLELLREFDGICKENGIKYYLTGETLLYAFCHGTMEPKAFSAKVLMTVDNAKKFIEVINKTKPANRAIEHWGNSRKYPDFTIKYTAKDSLCFNVLEKLNFNTHGFHIQIGILRGKVKAKRIKRLAATALELGIGAGGHNESLVPYMKGAKKNAMGIAIAKPIELVFGAGRVRKWLFNFYCKNAKSGSSLGKGTHQVYNVHYAKNKKVKMSSLYFDGNDTCMIEGDAYPVPKYTYAFLRNITSGRMVQLEEGGYKAVDRFAFRDNCVIDPEIPYEEYFARVENSNAAFKKVYKYKFKSEITRIKNRKHGKLATQNWQIVQQTDYRFKMGEQYLPMKEQIKALYEERNFEELQEVFKDYSDALDVTLKNKKSFAFDREILDIYIEMLAYNGQLTRIKNVLGYMPKTHTETVAVYEKDF